MPQTVYGDISPRTAAFTIAELLKRGIAYLVLEKFGQSATLPTNKTKTATFRRYNAIDPTPKALVEGVTPAASGLSASDYSLTLNQFGDRVQITDVIQDTHEDPVLKEATTALGEQAAEMIERVRFATLKAGSNVFYANGAARGSVNTVITLDMQRRIVRSLKRQRARKITSVVASSANYATTPVAPSFIALIHPDVESDVRNLPGFSPVENYASGGQQFESEVGKVEDVRYVMSQIAEPWQDAGGAAGSMFSTTGSNADVYPVLYFGRDAYGLVALKGKYAITPLVVNPQPSDSDPLAQRGHVGWKSMQGAIILNDAWMVRAEVAVTA